LVEAKSDLTKRETWEQSDGGIWTYVGMLVSVSADIELANRGLYMLVDKDWSLESSWQKMATMEEISSLREQIENLEIEGGGSLDVEVEADSDLPEIGDTNTTYYVKES
jgi:hypothetical protein